MIFDNPEFVRLRRSKLRPQKMLVLSGIGVFICGGILVLMYMSESDFGRHPVSDQPGMFRDYFFWCTGIELAVIGLFGGILSAQNVVLERERSTLDFQRMVGMGPWRLAVGKLFGAPLEAFWVASVCMLFSGFGVMGGGVSMGVFLQAQAALMVYAIMVSALGLLASSLVEKTSSAAGLAILFTGIGSMFSMSGGRGGLNIVSASSPIYYLVALYHIKDRGFLYTKMEFEFFGVSVPLLAGYCFINLYIAGMAFVACARRIAYDEFSFMTLRHAVVTFIFTELLLLSAFAGGLGTPMEGLMAFHFVNLALLISFSFGLTPSGELVRSRLHRAKPNEHWRVIFELRNRLQDSPSLACVLLMTVLYFMLGVGVTLYTGNAPVQAYAAIVMVAGVSIAVAAGLLYIHVYVERSSFRLAIVSLLAAFILPPLAMWGAASMYHAVLVSPMAYLGNLERLDRLALRSGPESAGAVWTCPLACVATGALGFMLVAMRVRYLLDLNESERKRDEVAQQKAELALPAATAAARLMAKQ
jgi:hypothetical protein